MSLHDDLLAQAGFLSKKEPRRPTQASLRQAGSAAHYALFHLLIDEATRRFVRGADRHELRRCLGRAFGHAEMKEVARQFASDKVSPKISAGLKGMPLQTELKRVAQAFANLQQARHEADYDLARGFGRQEVKQLIAEAVQAFRDWRAVRGTDQADTWLLGLVAQKNMKV